MIRWYFRSLLLLIMSVLPVLPQSQNDITRQIWVDVNATKFARPDLEFRGEIGARKEVENDGWWRLVIQPAVRYQIGSYLFLTGGIGSYYTFNKLVADRWEIRPYQGLFGKWPRGKKVYLEHYLRLDERFEFDTDTWDSKMSLRLRYRILLVYKFGAPFQYKRYWKIRAGGESFVTIAGKQGQFQERVRASISLDRSLRRGFVLRFEITWQKQSLFFISGESVDSIYIRLRLFSALGSFKIIY